MENEAYGMAMRNAIQLAQEELDQLQAKLKEFEKIKQRIGDIKTFIEKGKILTGIFESPGQSAIEPPMTERPRLIRRRFDPEHKTVWERTRDLIKEFDRPMKVPEITKEFYARGWSLSENNGTEVIRTSMLNKPDVFCKLEDGSFELIK